MEILFATGNVHKISEAAAILNLLGHTVSPLMIDGNLPELVEPQADDLETVASAKINQAKSMVQGTPLADSAILVEDSGLFIDSLDGFPGPFSSYVERSVGLNGILKLLDGTEERRAEYRAVAILEVEGRELLATGVCQGVIAEECLGERGFGYDPIFVPDEGDGRTCAQMSSEEKSEISHRGRALKVMSELLKSPSK
ncbi:MAG: RdgB/HAM1 family non-canonical purine NTP pyrophosphatase [Candidatus Thermoplasmatota archaeon]|nr:RdgB/HAM1 family non-canonical purine NTP pyrophosphatase [Candidatus Thermoplasmatota archaeon]